MTTAPMPVLLAAIFALGALAAKLTGDARTARRRGVAASPLAIAVSLLAVVVPAMHAWLPDGLLRVAPTVTGIVGLIAVGLAPVGTHPPATMSRILLLCGIGEAFVATTMPQVLAALWTASAWLTWQELRVWCVEEKWHRVFAWYQGLSAALFVAGTVMMARDSAQTGGALILAAIVIREGMIPFHSWFPRLVERAPMGVVVAFAGPQLGIYAQLELLGSRGAGQMAHELAVVGVVTAVGAAMLGVVQKNPRRAIAYLILSQTGLVAFGLESHSRVGLTGAVMNWQILALATSGFAMVLAALQARRGALNVTLPGGNFAETPRLGIAFIVLGFASVGFPMTAGFVAEDLLVQGTIAEFPLLGIALIIATGFNGITVLKSFFYLFTGTRERRGLPDLTRRERWVVGAVMATLIAAGVAPAQLLAFETATAHHQLPAGD